MPDLCRGSATTPPSGAAGPLGGVVKENPPFPNLQVKTMSRHCRMGDGGVSSAAPYL